MSELTVRCAKQFIEGNKDVNATVTKIIAKENESNRQLLDWDSKTLEKFLEDLHSISLSSLNKTLGIIRDFADYICEKERLPKKEFSLDFNRLQDLIDYPKLMTYIIDYEQYRSILSQLKDDDEGNMRDVVIFELAWATLSNDEIKRLKENDIEYVHDDIMDLEVILLNLESRAVRITDAEVIKDIKTCLKQTYYSVEDRNGIKKKMKFKESEYLIKPVLVGKSKEETYITNPSLVMTKALQTRKVYCDGINTNEMTIEDVRRSKIVYMLAPQNEKFFNFDFMNAYFDFGNSQASLYWYKKIAKLKYNAD